MSWQGQWAGSSTGRWYGYSAQPGAGEVANGGVVYAFHRPVERPRIGWLEARLFGYGGLGAELDGPLTIRARRRREEEYLRRLH